MDWVKFVHGENTEKCTNEMRMEERGTSGDFSDIVISCLCGKERPLYHATIRDEKNLGYCNGNMPWMGTDRGYVKCNEPNMLLTRTASNAYFPQKMSSISISEAEKTGLALKVLKSDLDPDELTIEELKVLLKHVPDIKILLRVIQLMKSGQNFKI